MRMRPLLMTPAFFLVLFAGTGASGQGAALDSIAAKMGHYGRKLPSSGLFVHYDKNVYADGETAWFKAYLFKGGGQALRHTLSVSLVSTADRTAVLSRQFPMSGGQANGDLQLPMGLPPGQYSLVAFSNLLRNGAPEELFVQPITVKSIAEASFTASLRLAADTGGSYQVQLNAFGKDKKPLPAGATVSYAIGDAPFQTAQTDAGGQYVLNIAAVPGTAPLLRAKVQSGKEWRELQLQLPGKRLSAEVKFYPESGHLVEGLQGYVGWEARAAGGAAGILYQDGIPLDTVQANNLGIGKFILTPLKGSVYTFRLAGEFSPEVFRLPAALPSGHALTMPQAVSGDTARVFVRGNAGLVGAALLVHDYRGLYLSMPVSMAAAGSRMASLPLLGVPRGLMSLTLVDSLGRPLAERMFFAHYQPVQTLGLSTSKAVYAPREKVLVKLELSGGKLAGTSLSVACVQASRLSQANSTDIESYLYLERELGSLPKTPDGGGFRDKSYMESILLVKGWRKYTWQELQGSGPQASPAPLQSLGFHGSVSFRGKPLNKPEVLKVYHGKFTSPVLTDSSGRFVLPPDMLVSKPDARTAIDVASQKAGYELRVINPYDSLGRGLAQSLEPAIGAHALAWSTGAQALDRAEKSILLQEVTLTANAPRIFRDFSSTRNACGDYVCVSQVLNCPLPSHITSHLNTPPVKGRTYRVLSTDDPKNFTVTTIVYGGCTLKGTDERRLLFDGIYAAREFYGADYSRESLPGPEYVSTLYWEPSLKLGAGGVAELSFYAGDIPGGFRVVVQGMAGGEAVYAEGSFTVAKVDK